MEARVITRFNVGDLVTYKNPRIGEPRFIGKVEQVIVKWFVDDDPPHGLHHTEQCFVVPQVKDRFARLYNAAELVAYDSDTERRILYLGAT